MPGDFAEQFALDHDHPAGHLEDQSDSPFAVAEPIGGQGESDGPGHESQTAVWYPPRPPHPEESRPPCARLAMLEPVYAPAPDLLRSGRVVRPPNDEATSSEARMTDFRLLRHGGFYHAVARYCPDI